jgi:hypothetical protein
MARNGDQGPYSAENVYICTSSQNIKDSYMFRPWYERAQRGAAKPKKTLDTGLAAVG